MGFHMIQWVSADSKGFKWDPIGSNGDVTHVSCSIGDLVDSNLVVFLKEFLNVQIGG